MSTNWIGVTSKNVNIPNWVKVALVALGGTGLLAYTLQLRLSNNRIWVKFRAFGKDWFKHSIGTIDVTSAVKEKLKGVKVTLPLSVIRSQNIPSSVEELTILADNVAGGLKVTDDEGNKIEE